MSFVSLVKLKVRLPDSAGVTTVPLEPQMTGADLIELVAGALKEEPDIGTAYKLVIPPAFNREQVIVLEREAAIHSFKVDPKVRAQIFQGVEPTALQRDLILIDLIRFAH